MAEFSLRPLDFSEDRVQLLRLTLARRRPLSYRNQSIDLLRKSMDWFLYDNSLRLERVNMQVALVARQRYVDAVGESEKDGQIAGESCS